MTTPVSFNPGRYGLLEPPGRTYVVRSGDTLSAIAKRSGITIDQILRANPTIKDADRIRVRQVIDLPDPPKAAALAMPKDASAPGRKEAASRDLVAASPSPPTKARFAAGPPASKAEAREDGGAGTGFLARLGQKLGSFWSGLFPSAPKPTASAPSGDASPAMLGIKRGDRGPQVEQNSGLDANGDGEITKAEAAAQVRQRLEAGLKLKG